MISLSHPFPIPTLLIHFLYPQGIDNRDLRLSGHVGFDSLPDQLVNKCVNKGFDFNVLCIGECIMGDPIDL